MDGSDFSPISELSRDDGDLTIAFLVGNGVQYMERVADPWYRGTVPNGKWQFVQSPVSTAPVVYRPEEAASPLGCLQQYQICNVDENHCGPLKGWGDYLFQSASVFNVSEEAVENAEFVENNPLGQRLIWFATIVAYVGHMAILKALGALGAYSLSSQSSMTGGIMGSLAENQWQFDVERWWATGLASLQAAMVDVAVGPTEAALQPYTIPAPTSYIQHSFCNSQVGTVSSDSRDAIVLTKSLCTTENIDHKIYIVQPLWGLLHLHSWWYHLCDILFAGARPELSTPSKKGCGLRLSGMGDNGELTTPTGGVSRHRLRYMDRSL